MNTYGVALTVPPDTVTAGSPDAVIVRVRFASREAKLIGAGVLAGVVAGGIFGAIVTGVTGVVAAAVVVFAGAGGAAVAC